MRIGLRFWRNVQGIRKRFVNSQFTTHRPFFHYMRALWRAVAAGRIFRTSDAQALARAAAVLRKAAWSRCRRKLCTASRPMHMRRLEGLCRQTTACGKSVIIHVADEFMARDCVTEWPATAQALAAAFWPGPLTLVLPADEIPEIVTAGGTTVGVQLPRHPFMQELIRTCRFPLAAPSAGINHITHDGGPCKRWPDAFRW